MQNRTEQNRKAEGRGHKQPVKSGFKWPYQLVALCWRQSRLWRGRCAALKKRSVTKSPSSSSVVSLLVLKFARFLFISPVLESLWSPISEIQEGPCVQSTIAQGFFTNKYSRPAGAGFVSCSRPPKAPAGGARGAGDWLDVPPGGAPAPLGAFSGKWAWAGGGTSRAYFVSH